MYPYPSPCIRCGFCCLAETCPVGQIYYGIGKHDRCPGLKIEAGTATCGLAHTGMVGIGAGCCIKARAFRDGVEYDFAGLPPEIKKAVVAQITKGIDNGTS